MTTTLRNLVNVVQMSALPEIKRLEKEFAIDPRIAKSTLLVEATEEANAVLDVWAAPVDPMPSPPALRPSSRRI